MKKNPRKPKADEKKLAQIWVMGSTKDLIRQLARMRRQSMVFVIDDAVRAQYAVDVIITADEDQSRGHHGE